MEGPKNLKRCLGRARHLLLWGIVVSSPTKRALLRLRACQHLAVAYAETDHLAIESEAANRDSRSVGTKSWHQARRAAALGTRANTELAHTLARLPDHHPGLYQKFIERPVPQDTHPPIRGMSPAPMPDVAPESAPQTNC